MSPFMPNQTKFWDRLGLVDIVYHSFIFIFWKRVKCDSPDHTLVDFHGGKRVHDLWAVFHTVTHVQSCNLQTITQPSQRPLCTCSSQWKSPSVLSARSPDFSDKPISSCCISPPLSHAVIAPFHHIVFVIRVVLTATLWWPDVVSAPRPPLREWGPCLVMWFPGLSGGSVGVGRKEEKGATGLTHATRGSAVV